MSRRLNALLRRGFRASKCNTLLKLTASRIKLLRNKRDIAAKQARKDIALLLQTGQEATARIRIENVFREENTLAAYDLIQQFCELVINRLPTIDAQKTCPLDLKEAIASLVFAAPRCPDLQELQQVRDLFIAKYGKEFAAAAAELRPECGVNRQIIEKLSSRAPAGDKKLKLMKEIASEHNIDWIAELEQAQSELLKPPEDLLDGSRHLREDPAAAQTGSKNDASRLESIKSIPSVDLQADDSASLAAAYPASPSTSSSHGDGDALSPVEGKLPPWGIHDSHPHDTPVLSNSKDAADSMTRLADSDHDTGYMHVPFVDTYGENSKDAADSMTRLADSDHDTGYMHVPFVDTYSIAKEEGEMDLKSIPDPRSSTEEGESITAPPAEAPFSLSKSDEPSNPPSRNLSAAGSSFKMSGRMEYKDFASAAQAAFESAARAAEAAQAAVDLARTFSKPSSDTKAGSSDSEEESTNSKKAKRTASGSRRNKYDNNGESWADSHNATNVAENAPRWPVYSEQKSFDGNDGETASDSDDGVGGMSSNRASQHTIHDERFSRVNLGTAADLDPERSSSESAGESERNPGPVRKRRGAAGDDGLLQTRRNDLYGLGRPRFDDDAADDARIAAFFTDGRAELDKRDFEKFTGSPNRPIQQRVSPKQGRPFAEEDNPDSGEEVGRKTRWKTEVNVRKAARKEAIDGPPFEPQFDELADRAPLRSYNRKQQETSHGQWYVAAGDTAAASNHLTDKLISSRRADIAASHRKLRWNSSASSKETDGGLQLELDSNDHQQRQASNQRHNFGSVTQEGEPTQTSQKHGALDESRTSPNVKTVPYYGQSRRSMKSLQGVAELSPSPRSSFEREDASTHAIPPDDAPPAHHNNFRPIPPPHTPSSTLTAHVLDRKSSSSSSSSSDSSIHPTPSSQPPTNQTSAASHPPKHPAESPKSKPLEAASSEKTPVSRPFTHPKLPPDYDEFAARFKALKKKR